MIRLHRYRHHAEEEGNLFVSEDISVSDALGDDLDTNNDQDKDATPGTRKFTRKN